jgi:hypothetical protein
MPGSQLELKRALYERLYIAAQDFEMARQYAAFLTRKGWHSAPYERRGTVYMQQSAFTTALVVSYARPFTKSFGWPPLPNEIARYEEPDLEMHEYLLGLRHEVYAHSDSSRHRVRPFRIGNESLTDLVGTPFLRLSKFECEMVISMVTSKIKMIHPLLTQLRQELAETELNHALTGQ